MKNSKKTANNLDIQKEVRLHIANNFLSKAKKENNEKILVRSLYWVIRIDFEAKDVPNNLNLLLDRSKKVDDNEFPAKAHLLKSEYLIYKGKTIEGLEEAFLAERMAKAKNNSKQSLLIKKQVGLINVDLNRYDVALQQFKEYKAYFEGEKENSREYIYAIFMISNIYNITEKPDVALEYIQPVLSKISKDNFFYKFLVLNKGISYYLKKEYTYSEKLLQESIILLKKNNISNSLATAYFYLGKNKLDVKGELNETKKYFLKTDSLILDRGLYYSSFRDNYVELIEIAKRTNNNKEQLQYLNRLITFDSIINRRSGQLSKVINDKYDTPQLILEKENIINKLNKQKQYSTLFIGILLFGFLSLGWWYIRKLKSDKNKFLQLIAEKSDLKNEEPAIVLKDQAIKKIEFPQEIAEEILDKLKKFEKNLGYLDPTIKQVDLAKQLNTNSSYLSKTINYYKNKNFSQYLNDLRIDYSIKKIQADKKFRKFTIKAIAEEVGFNNAESFSKSFSIKTGIQPSYFIKKLNESESKKTDYQ